MPCVWVQVPTCRPSCGRCGWSRRARTPASARHPAKATRAPWGGGLSPPVPLCCCGSLVGCQLLPHPPGMQCLAVPQQGRCSSSCSKPSHCHSLCYFPICVGPSPAWYYLIFTKFFFQSFLRCFGPLVSATVQKQPGVFPAVLGWQRALHSYLLDATKRASMGLHQSWSQHLLLVDNSVQ